MAQNVVYFVATRFRTSAVPFQILLAAVAIVWAGHAIRVRLRL